MWTEWRSAVLLKFAVKPLKKKNVTMPNVLSIIIHYRPIITKITNEDQNNNSSATYAGAMLDSDRLYL